ncbi:hypothetical protein V5799_022415 [Amblyomma americanum]|uniref:Uncharacterized protein n=1 Tax=Amblyomma americanum TaxID=6943 RepID=A0AAQ4FKK5_AMBAM
MNIEASPEADGFPRYLRGLNPHIRPMMGFNGKMPASMLTGSDWIFLESALVWLTPRGYEGAVLLWRVSLETLAARRGYTDLLERMTRRFEKERLILSVVVDAGDTLKQRLDLGELAASLPTSAEGPTAASILLHPIVGEPPLARTRGVEDQRSAVLYEKNRLQEVLKQLQSTMKQIWDSSQVFEFGVVSKQGANWVSHLTEFVVPPLARFLRYKFRARCFGVWNLWHDDFAGVCGGGRYPLMRNLFGVFSEPR